MVSEVAGEMVDRDELVALLQRYLKSRHSTLFGRSRTIHSDREQCEAAEWYAEVFMGALALRHLPQE